MFNFFRKKRGQGMVDYALILGLVVVAVMSTVSHLGDFNDKNFDILSHTFQDAERAYKEELLNLQNAQTIKEYASVANGTASAGVAQSWAGSTVYGQDNIGSADDYNSGNTGTGSTVNGGGADDNSPPIARFGFYNDIRPALGKTFKLLNTSYDEDGDRIAKAEWSGVPSESMFKSAGVFTIKLRVADEHGAWSEWYEETFTIENIDPIAVITKDAEFSILEEEDEDLAIDDNKYYLMGKAHTTLNLYDESSYDPDGHPLVTSYWSATIDDIENTYEEEFGKGLLISQNKSGPVTIKLRVEDKYGGLSDEVSTSFYYFASERPEIRNITLSDGSNGELTLDTLTQEDWVTEIYPYTGGATLQIPVSDNALRFNFQIEDDSDYITAYQYRFNGVESDVIALNKTNKEDKMFYMAHLNEDFKGKNGSATLSFRTKDDSDTWSRWTEDIPVTFLSISEIHPLIKEFTIENYSTFDNQAIPTEPGQYFKGSFRGTIKIDDIYGNMRTIEELFFNLNDAPLDYTNLTKVNGTTYTFEFEIDEVLTNAKLSVQGIYDNTDQTDVATIENINIQKYTLMLTQANLYNYDHLGWWNVDLTKTGNETINRISGLKSINENSSYITHILYSSVFNAPIESIDIAFYDSSFNMTALISEEDIRAISNQELEVTINPDWFNSHLDPNDYNYIIITLIDSMGNESNPSIETGTIVKLIDPDIYSTTLVDYEIKDGENNKGKADKVYSRGILNFTFEIEDFFYPIRTNNEKETLNFALNNDMTGVILEDKGYTIDSSTGTILTTSYTLDTHSWIEWENTTTPILNTNLEYLNQSFLIDVALSNYSPNLISHMDYKTKKFSGVYTLTLLYSKYKDYFDISTIHVQTTANGTTKNYTLTPDDYTVMDDGKIIFSLDRLPSRVLTNIKIYLTHTNNVENSLTYEANITIEKPYEIEVAQITHRAPTTTTNGFTKMFTGKQIVDTTKDVDLIQMISIANQDYEYAPISEVSMTHTSPTKGPLVYAEYKKLGFTPTGTIIFANENVGSDQAGKLLINATAARNTSTSVTDTSYGHDIFTIFSGDVIYDNTAGSGSGIYYKTNTHYLDTVEQSKRNSTTIKYINMCTPENWDSTNNSCSAPFSVEATIYDNGSVRVHYSTLPQSIIEKSIIGGKINVEQDDVFEATAYGEYDGTFSGKSLRFNTLPAYYLIPPIITDVEYGQSKSTTKETIDPATSETKIAEYIIHYENPDNVSIITHEGSLSQNIYDINTNTSTPHSAQIVPDGSVTNSGSIYKFDSKNVIRRNSSLATIKLRLQYSNNPLYYTAYFVKENVEYVGPIMINFTATVPTHVEPTKNISGYTSIDFTSGLKGNCPTWSANSSSRYDDCSSALIPLGFEMAYINGERVSSFSVSTNSLIRFDNVVKTGYTAQPVTGLEDDTLAVLWYDQDFQGTSTSTSSPKGIFYKRFLTAQIPYVSIKYIGMTAYSYGVAPFDYEVQIYQDGKIIIHYSKEVPVKLKTDGNGNYTELYTTTAFKKTMLTGYGSLILPNGDLDELMDYVSKRKLAGDVQSLSSYTNMDTKGRSIQIDLNKCNTLDGSCGTYTPPSSNPNSTIYSCTNGTQTINLGAGTYKIQAWGAQGAKQSSSSTYTGGKGGYAEGTIKLDRATTLYLNVGCSPNSSTTNIGGFNGGGSAFTTGRAGGGGASDVRLHANTLARRIIVAGGGGGAGSSSNGGAGGGLEGLSISGTNNGLGGSPDNSIRPTINTLGYPGSFGKGGNQIATTSSQSGGAGGGGYYGGGAGINGSGAGGGGSSYVYNGGNISNIKIYDGMSAMPTTDNSGTKIGHTGNGYIIITRLTGVTATSFNIDQFIEDTNDFETLYPSNTNFDIATRKLFEYQNSPQSVILDPGTYKLQVWGAQGGTKNSSYPGGKGGYSEGIVTIAETTEAYILTGGLGTTSSSTVAGGYNGGGSASANGASGGGATDIRLFQNTLANRVIVAGGGGGGSTSVKGGAGGGSAGTVGSGTNYGLAGTQDAGGTTYDYNDACANAGTLGIGGNFTCSGIGAGGGGGYYGGGAGANSSGAGGGSGFIHSKLVNSKTTAGTGSMPTTNGSSTETGHASSGYAIITKLTNDTANSITVDEFADFKIGDIREFSYTGEEQTVMLDPGTYKIQAWGAEGGTKSNTYPGGKGGYTEGIITVNDVTPAYIYVGGEGLDASSENVAGGYNGGGSATANNASGGGATDIRLNNNATSNRIMVAAGGGAGSSSGAGGAGGNIIGENGSGSQYGIGATNSTGGTTFDYNNACAGTGSSGTGGNFTCSGNGAGGGGGYYGGGAGANSSGAGGGSSYISNHFINAQTISGNAEMPNSSGSYQIGQSGNGFVKITRLQNNEGIFQVGETRLYDYNHGTYVEVLPYGLYEIKVWGASGGNALQNTLGGKGGYTDGRLRVSTNNQLFLTVGGEGASQSGNLALGGYNGGGIGSIGSGGGGGASDIRSNGTALTNRILVAGGGGGASYYDSNRNGTGGAGGGLTGINATSQAAGYEGIGGSSSAGGVPGTVYQEDAEKNGTLGIGGSITTTRTSFYYKGGGGGGGYYGGSAGGGYAAGGGGGSSYYSSALTSPSTTPGNTTQPSPLTNGTQEGNTGNGYIKIYRIE